MTTTDLPRPSTFPEQAAQRVNLYADTLLSLGITPATPLRFLAVLTTGLPGEVIEIAVLDGQGNGPVLRARPHGPIDPGAQMHHGLSAAVLSGEAPLTEQLEPLLSALAATGEESGPPTVITWAGPFIEQALRASLGPDAALPAFTSLQDAVHEQDLRLNPLLRYRPSLPGMNYTVEMPATDPTSASANANALRVVTQAILNRQHVTTPPPIRPRP